MRLRPLLDQSIIAHWSPEFQTLWRLPHWVRFSSHASTKDHTGYATYCRVCSDAQSRAILKLPSKELMRMDPPLPPLLTKPHTFEWMGPIAYSRQTIFAEACGTCKSVMWTEGSCSIVPYLEWQYEAMSKTQASTIRIETQQTEEPG